MMVRKRVLRPERLRRIPGQFSWIDQRLVKDDLVDRCGIAALALYLVLVTVADQQGLSYYSDERLARRLCLAPVRLRQARATLIEVGLIAFEAPLYQVLSLDAPTLPRTPGLRSIQAGLTAWAAQRHTR